MDISIIDELIQGVEVLLLNQSTKNSNKQVKLVLWVQTSVDESNKDSTGITMKILEADLLSVVVLDITSIVRHYMSSVSKHETAPMILLRCLSLASCCFVVNNDYMKLLQVFQFIRPVFDLIPVDGQMKKFKSTMEFFKPEYPFLQVLNTHNIGSKSSNDWLLKTESGFNEDVVERNQLRQMVLATFPKLLPAIDVSSHPPGPSSGGIDLTVFIQAQIRDNLDL